MLTKITDRYRHLALVLIVAALLLALYSLLGGQPTTGRVVCNEQDLSGCGPLKAALLYALDSWDEMSAIGQLIGSLASVAALVGLLGIYKQIRSEQLALNTQTSWTMYDASLAVLDTFVREPELRPYFYDNKPLPMYEPARSRVLATAEVVGDHLENIVMSGHSGAISSETFYVWVRYIYMMGRRSQVMRRFLSDRPHPLIDIVGIGLGEGLRYDERFTGILLAGKVPDECRQHLAEDHQPLPGLRLQPIRVESIGAALRDDTALHRRIVDWERSQWGDEWAAYVEGQIASTIAADARHPAVPEIYVALAAEGLPMGCIMLLTEDMTTRPDLAPWIGGLYVDPAYRRQGVAAALMMRALDEAALTGLETVWLYTEDQRRYYARFGWTFVEQAEYEQAPVTIMRFDFYDKTSRRRDDDEAATVIPLRAPAMRAKFRRLRP